MRRQTQFLLAAAASLALTQSVRAVDKVVFDHPSFSGDYHDSANWINSTTSAQQAPTQSLDVDILNGTANVRAGHTANEGGANQFRIGPNTNNNASLIIDQDAIFAPRF